MEEKKEKRVLTIELDNNVKKVSITGLAMRRNLSRPREACLQTVR